MICDRHNHFAPRHIGLASGICFKASLTAASANDEIQLKFQISGGSDTPVARINKDSITAQVHQYSASRNRSWNIQPGARIVEDRLAQQLGISKTPLRLALHQLKQDKIVNIEPRRGIYLAVPTLREFLELIEMREVLEGLAARRAALQPDRKFVQQMKTCFAAFNKANVNELGGKGKYAAADHRFHRLLVQASGSAELVANLSVINIRLHMNRLRRSFSKLRDLRPIHQEHMDIIGAIEAGDAKSAEVLVRTHIRNVPWQQLLQGSEHRRRQSRPSSAQGCVGPDAVRHSPIGDRPGGSRCVGGRATLAALVRTKRLGIALMVMSAGLLTVGDATAKWLSTTYPIGEIIFIRGLLIVMLLGRDAPAVRACRIDAASSDGTIRRALFFVLATFLMIWSLSLLPLATASAISFAAPIITTALAPWMLGETVGLAALDCSSGRLPRRATDRRAIRRRLDMGAADPRRSRGSSIVTRYRDPASGRHRDQRIGGVRNDGSEVLAGAMSAPFGWINPSAWAWVMPSAWDFALFTFYSVATCAAYLMQVGALRAAEAAFLAPFKYSLMLWAILIGFAVWGHVPSVAVLAGSAIIICSGIFIWYREVGMRGRHV